MVKVYKIHPGIGIARVGLSPDGFFLAAETAEAKPFELDENGHKTTFKGYKDANKLMRRQGARFRVFEYDQDDATGEATLVREITASDAQIKWTVRLANSKSAGLVVGNGPGFEGSTSSIPNSNGIRRNAPPAGGDLEDLKAKVDLEVMGENVPPGPRKTGKIHGIDVFIGEVMTDAAGRLVVLGGEGNSGSWQTPEPDMPHWLNNPGWFDDTADGTVDAKLVFSDGGGEVDVQHGSWVIVAPPNFAPEVRGITTLHDIMVDRLSADADMVSFQQDILPILNRTASYYWVNVHGEALWKFLRETLTSELDKLASNDDEHRQLRGTVRAVVQRSEQTLRQFRLTKTQEEDLEDWHNGRFLSGTDPSRPVQTIADDLDKTALDQTIGGGFFPGIEAGLILTYPTIYSGYARMTRGEFKDFDDANRRLEPGMLTERMAVPWQADFVECQGDWWPAQRPDVARFLEDGSALPSPVRWDRGVAVTAPDGPLAHNKPSRKNMVDHFAKLGVMEKKDIGGETVFVETGRALDEAFNS